MTITNDLANWAGTGSNTSVLIANGSNIGIGTASPARMLHVNGDAVLGGSPAAQYSNVTISGSAGIQSSAPLLNFVDAAGSTRFGYLYHTGTAGTLYLLNQEAGAVRFGTNNTERMRIDSSGNVGIGTTSPIGKLDVYQNIAATDLSVLFRNNATAAATIVQLTGGLSQWNAIKSLDNSSNQNWYIGGNGTANTLAFMTGTTERMRIDSSGNMGIGRTPAAGFPLDVSATTGNMRLTSTTGTNYAQLQTINGSGTARFGVEGSGGGNIAAGSSAYSAVVSQAGAYSLHLGTNNTVQATIDSSGNMGIGTSSPSAKLHVVNATGGTAIYAGNANASLYVNYLDGGVNYIGGSTTVFRNGAGTTEFMRIDSAGNMGIGTSSPTSTAGITTLQVSSASSTSRIIWESQSNSRKVGWFLDTGNGFGVYDYTAAAERMRIDSSGNVGIGTSSPGYKLEVNGYVTSSGLRQLRQDTGSEGGQIEMCAANNNAIAWNIDVYGSTTTPALRVFNASAVGVTLVSGATAWTTMSDINLKTDLQPIEDAIDTLKDIRCVTYRFKDIDEPDSKRRIGIIAQDIVGKVDEALDHAQMKGDPNDYLSVRYTELVPHLIKAIQELSAKNTALEDRIKTLENNK